MYWQVWQIISFKYVTSVVRSLVQSCEILCILSAGIAEGKLYQMIFFIQDSCLSEWFRHLWSEQWWTTRLQSEEWCASRLKLHCVAVVSCLFVYTVLCVSLGAFVILRVPQVCASMKERAILSSSCRVLWSVKLRSMEPIWLFSCR